MKVKFIVPLLALTLVFSFAIGCSNSFATSATTTTKMDTTTQTTIAQATTTTKALGFWDEENQATTSIVETTTTINIDMDKVKFWEAIIDDEANYALSDKMFEYSMEKINILSDFIDGKISRDEEIAKFYELSDKVHDDFYAVDIMINKRLEEKSVIPSEDMKNLITVIKDWAYNTEKSSYYYAKYLETNQAAYDLKVEECEKEAEDLFIKYLELRKPFIEEYNRHYNIK